MNRLLDFRLSASAVTNTTLRLSPFMQCRYNDSVLSAKLMTCVQHVPSWSYNSRLHRLFQCADGMERIAVTREAIALSSLIAFSPGVVALSCDSHS